MLLPHSQPPHKSAGTHLSGTGTGIGDYGDFLMMPKAKLQNATMACIPADLERKSVSKALEFAYNDWNIATMAKGMAATISPRNKANAPGAAATTRHAMDE